MASDYFFLVPQIVQSEKYFDVSIPEIFRAVSTPAGKFDRTEEHSVVDEYGGEYRMVIRLNVNCQSIVPEGWTAALKLHKWRIDGIDWESEFDAIDGSTGYGWHRRRWDQKARSAEKRKIPIADLDGIDGREQFLIRVFKIMHIRVSAVDYGDQLSIDEGGAT